MLTTDFLLLIVKSLRHFLTIAEHNFDFISRCLVTRSCNQCQSMVPW